MSLNVETNNAVLTNDIELETREVKEKLKDKKIVYRLIKRIVDIIGGLVGTILLLPITAILYIVNKISKENRGPLFFDQLRIGKDGKEFKLYKYRSMVMHADEKLWEYLNENEEAKEEYCKYKKLKNDPRITKLGKFLRKTSLDEFPQFVNVLKGEMSLVGPRPYLYREREDMGEKYNEIIKVKPGLTGYWQVNGRSGVDFDERMEMDTYYIQNRTLWLDFKILVKTVLKVFGKRGGAL